jgi:chromosome segregation ATPase
MSDLAELDAGIQEAQRSLVSLQERLAQVRRDRQQQQQLEHRRENLRRELRQNRGSNPSRLPELKEELRQIQSQLETLELNLESELFSLSSLKEPFWQALRFGGLGIIVGWLLKACAS